MRNLFFCLAVAVSAIGTSASAQSWYGQVNVGTSFNGSSDVEVIADDGTGPQTFAADIDQANGYLVSGNLGHDFGGLRVDGELLFTNNDLELYDFGGDNVLDGVSIEQVTALLNISYDFENESDWTPYVGAGVGFGAVRFKDSEPDPEDSLEETDQGFAWQLKAGVSYAFSDRASLDLGYRYLAAPDFSYSEEDGGESISFDVETEQHTATIGVRFSF